MPSPVIYDPTTGAKDARPIFASDDAFASGAVQSGKLGADSVNTVNVIDGSITSGKIASGQLGSVHIRQLSIEGFDIADGAIASGKVASGSIGSVHIGNEQVRSGDIGSGAIGDPNIIGSGMVGQTALGNNVVRSGHIQADAVGSPHLASGAVQSGHIGNEAVVSGSLQTQILTSVHIASGGISIPSSLGDEVVTTRAIQSGDIRSGLLGAASGLFGVISGTLQTALPNGEAPVHSGNIASGTIGAIHLQDNAINESQLASGVGSQKVNSVSFLAGELISGLQSVLPFSGSNFLQVAMAGVSGRMPALGVVDASGGISSGDPIPNMITHGFLDLKVASGNGVALNGTDGLVGYVSRSGTINTNPPSNSGEWVQVVVQSISSGLHVNIDPHPIQL